MSYLGAIRGRTRTVGPVDARAAGFSKDTISGLVHWWAASHIAGVAEGGIVSAIADKSGTLDLTVSGDPRFNKGVLNGWPVVTFDTNDSAHQANNIGVPCSVWYVGRHSGATKLRVLTCNYAVSGVNWLLGYWGGYKYSAYFDGWVENSTTATDTLWHIWGCDITGSGTNSNFYHNSTTARTSNQNGVTGPNQLGVNAHAAELSNCQIAEVLAWNKVLSSAERARAFAYLNGKYAIA